MAVGLGLLASFFFLGGLSHTASSGGFVAALVWAGPGLAAMGMALFISSFALGW